MNKQKPFGSLRMALTGAFALVLTFGVVVALTLVIVLRRASPPSKRNLPTNTVSVTDRQALDLPAGGVTETGKHVVIHAPPAEQANMKSFAAFSDTALELYARELGVALPREPIAVYLIGAKQEYERALALYDKSASVHNPGFAHGGNAFIYFAPHPGETSTDSDSRIAHMLDHELCHALHQRLYPNYGYQPAWLVEGLADAWSERACSGTDALAAGRSPWFSAMVLALRQAIRQGETHAIIQILKQPHSAYTTDDARQQYLTYSRSFALVRMLDDPTPINAPRHARFRAFLKAVDALEGNDIEAQVNARFQEQFGGTHLNALQAELDQRIATEKVFPWRTQGGEVHRRADGALLMAEDADHVALAFDDGRCLSTAAHLHARIEIARMGNPQVELLFGGTTPTDYFVVQYGSGYVTLCHCAQFYQAIGSQWVDPRLFASGSHTLDVTFHIQQVEVRLDGRRIGSFELPSDSIPSGQWGVGASGGRIAFRDLAARDSPP